MSNETTKAVRTPEQNRVRRIRLKHAAPFLVGDHVELARRALAIMFDFDGADFVRAEDGSLYSMFRSGDAGGNPEKGDGYRRCDIMSTIADFSGRRIVDGDGDWIGVVKLTYVDLCGIADAALALCHDWAPDDEEEE